MRILSKSGPDNNNGDDDEIQIILLCIPALLPRIPNYLPVKTQISLVNWLAPFLLYIKLDRLRCQGYLEIINPIFNHCKTCG